MNRRLSMAALVAVLASGSYGHAAQSPIATPASPSPDELLSNFQNPPNGARPRVWWHWMNGNIAAEGIRLDLDWMRSVGVGGVTIFEGAISTPQVVPNRLIYMTPEWKDAFKYAVTTARDHGMEVAIASSPGWSETGGPWVPAAQGMKKMVWSATRVEGGQPFTGKLPHPPQVDGTFQNFQVPGRRGSDGRVVVPPEYYGDVTVIAYKLPKDDKTQAELNPTITASGGTPAVAALSDGDVNTVAIELKAAEQGGEPWLQFDYGHPQKIQAVTLAALDGTISVFDHDNGAPTPRIESSDDGSEFRKIADIPFSSLVQRTVSFKEVTARYFRIVYSKGTPPQRLTEAVLSSGARVNQFEKRAGYANARDFFAITDPEVASESIVVPRDVIDLSGKMQADGTLDWTPPAGRWMVLRIGFSLTGHENGPAPAEATGLEVDKFNRDYVKNYVDGYLKMYADTVGSDRMGKNGISYMLTDSIEVGPQNWTDKMLVEFQKRRGYDAHPWLPALTGVVIKSSADTDRFLWDFRRTIGQLLAENHYGEISEELHAKGLSYYGEALEQHRPSLGDDMEMRSKTDIPMGALWTWANSPGPEYSYLADLRGAASVAHIYGQNIVGAESMTSRGPAWSFSPNNLKTVADLEFALGVNRFQIHESSHQPLADMAPGLTLGPYGIWFNRNDTWASSAGPWVDYLARCSYMLQQGHFYADVAYFYGEEGPLTAVFGWNAAEDLPEGYGFDFVNSDVILNDLTFKNGRLVTPGGTSYRILYLGGRSQRMTLPVLEKLMSLVNEGAVLVGNKPTDSPSLADDETQFQKVANRLFGGGTPVPGIVHRLGKGRVYIGMSSNDVLKALDVPRDFEFSRPADDTNVMFVHRKIDGGEIYFVDSRNGTPQNVEATFRVAGKAPELWDPATGKRTQVSYKIANGRTTVPLHLDPNGSTFVVFTKPASETSYDMPEEKETQVSGLDEALNSKWHVSFQSGRGAPESAEFEHLTSWSESAADGIRYFSGTATYSRTIEVAEGDIKAGAHYWLDLGAVKDLADVTLNGTHFGILWKSPFKVDVTDALEAGSNSLVIQVTNLWVNRLIGDQQPYAVKKYTFTDFAPYKADSHLLPSGLLGPVRISEITN